MLIISEKLKRCQGWFGFFLEPQLEFYILNTFYAVQTIFKSEEGKINSNLIVILASGVLAFVGLVAVIVYYITEKVSRKSVETLFLSLPDFVDFGPQKTKPTKKTTSKPKTVTQKLDKLEADFARLLDAKDAVIDIGYMRKEIDFIKSQVGSLEKTSHLLLSLLFGIMLSLLLLVVSLVTK